MVTTEKSTREYMLSFIKKICDECGTRRSASESERKACKLIKEECETHADEVTFDTFRTTYHAYPTGLVRVGAGFLTIGIASMVTTFYWIQIALALFGLWVIVAELMVMLEFIDPFYRKDESHNVFGVIKPSKEPKMKVILGGHSDSAYEMPFAEKLGVKISGMMFGAIGYGMAGLAFTVIKIVLDLNGVQIDAWTYAGIFRVTWVDVVYLLASIAGYPFLIWVVWNASNRSTEVLGANDNLSGVAVAMALGRHFKEHRPEHVEIWFGSFGAEEAGQRGSRRFVRKYGVDGNELDNSYTIVLESLSGMGFGILSAEKMYLTWPSMKPVHHSKELVDKFMGSVENYTKERRSIPLTQVHEATFAGTDAVRFSQKGFKAIALVAGGSNMFIDNWHNRKDTPENINRMTLWHAANMCATFVDDLDKDLAGKA